VIELDPTTVFSLIIGLPLLLILGMGATIGLVMWFLDRQVRQARAQAAQRAAAPATERRKARSGGGGGPRLATSPITRMVTAEGVVEAAPSMGLAMNKLGMWIFLASEVMFFTALIATFVSFRVRGMMDIPGEALNVPLAAVNTFILIVSSFTVVMALESVQDGREGRFILFLLATLALGSVFIGIQGIEWSELFQHGVTPSSDTFGTAFFVLTGFHGMHVIIGLLWLLFALLKAFRGDFTRENNLGIELFGLYWHFVDIVWIILFTIIYLI
jgi:heme/copper-type cytochrome/quinol oxidase subunit 3